MTRPLPFGFSQSVARNGPYSVWYIFHTSHFFESIPITWWEEIAVRNVNFSKCSFIFRTLKKTVIRILTQNDVNFKFQLFHRKLATAENTDQAECVHWSLVRNYTACSKMLFDKDTHSNCTWIYTLIWVSPLFANQGRMHKQWGLISLYICNVWSVINDSQIILEKNSNINTTNKIHLSHVNASMAKKEIADS